MAAWITTISVITWPSPDVRAAGGGEPAETREGDGVIRTLREGAAGGGGWREQTRRGPGKSNTDIAPI
ncbi:hypothetical protein GCM10023085_29540 [Actinomadura viridis]